MSTLPIKDLVRRHCESTKPSYNLDGFIQIAYGISARNYRFIVAGKRPASAQFLRRLEQAHHRLFPSEPVTVLLPNQPPVLLGLQTSKN